MRLRGLGTVAVRLAGMETGAYGFGLQSTAADGTVLDTWYPQVGLGTPGDEQPPAYVAACAGHDPVRDVVRTVVTTVIDITAAPQDVADAYLRLHLLSHRVVAPHGLNLDGVFGVLTNVVWTSAGPCPITGFGETRAKLQAAHGAVAVYGIDKFPRMTDYVVPAGVRIADADRVRLGAHLAEGTTVMHEGFVNFNAGSLGASMIEGRVSAGVVLGDGTDVGGGASIMGTLSGGGKEVIAVGRNCLLGANAGVGISLGDNCVVEAGLYVTSGTKVSVLGADGLRVVAARDLSGVAGLQFWRNSQTGIVEARPRTGETVELNAALHAN